MILGWAAAALAYGGYLLMRNAVNAITK